MSEAFLRVRNVAKRFVLHQRGGIELPVLQGVNLDVRAGECVVLDGPSGSGKSSLLKLIHANYRASAGSIHVGELEVTRAPPRELVAMRRSQVGYVSQFLRAIPRVATLDIVAEPLLDGVGDDSEALREAQSQAQTMLRRLMIPSLLWHLPPATFSGGEQQRVNLARGLIRVRPLLLLDEPTASLDAENRRVVVRLIHEARDHGAAVVGIFHDAQVRQAVASRVVDMAQFR